MSLLKKINLNDLKQIFHSKRFIVYSNLTLFAASVFIWKIFWPEINRCQSLQVSVLVLSLVLPLTLAVKEKIRFLFLAACIFTSISLFWYNIDHLPEILLKQNIIMLNISGIIFLILFLLIFKIKMPDLCRKIMFCIYAGIMSLPLLCYFSFDWNRMLNAYHVSFLLGDVWEYFWNNHDIRFALVGLGIRLTVLLACMFIMQLPFPAPKFRCNWYAMTFVALTSLFLLYESRLFYLISEQLSFPLANTRKGTYRKISNSLTDGSYEVKNAGVPGLYFLIIGESHEYKPAYRALCRKETFFKSIHNDPDYFVFKNVSWIQDVENNYLNYAGRSDMNVCNMMSLAPQLVSRASLANAPDFLDVMQFLKYKSLFIHNVGQWLSFNITMHAMFKRADFSLVTDNKSYGRKYWKKGFQVDNEIPDNLQRMYRENVFDKKRSFTVIKPLGLHGGDVIIPEDFARKHNDMDEQELGLLYYDEILAKIISVLRSFPETRAIVYCSDHGVDEKDIVMFVYLSDELQRLRPELAGKIKKLSEEKFCNFHIDRLLFEIMDISVSKKQPPQGGIINNHSPVGRSARRKAPCQLRCYITFPVSNRRENRAMKTRESPGGVMFNFSCSGLMDSELFQKITASAALEANVEARIVGKFTQSPDHPVLLSVPETFYLKGLCTVI